MSEELIATEYEIDYKKKSNDKTKKNDSRTIVGMLE